ncbi:MAG: macro domain-containing protein [bacterium]|nr:macro domain-containing protein [bacterium]
MSPKDKIHILQGDITDSECQAIVNAANTDLWLGSGVAGAISKKGGPSIQKECSEIGPVDLGEAAVTSGGDLKAKYVIHAASMDFDNPTTEESLYDSVKNCLIRAEELELNSIAFPAIGTGVGEFDSERCAEIMLGEILIRLPHLPKLERVEVILFEKDLFDTFQQELDRL